MTSQTSPGFPVVQVSQDSNGAKAEVCGGVALASEFLTFTLGNEDYGVDILRVQEIRGYESVTHIANAPDFIKGVINLRGVIVPLVDLRIKFNLDNIVYDRFTVVIILNVAASTVGMVVDGVSDVVNLNADQIISPPDMCSGIGSNYVIGLGTIDSRLLILVDIEKLMIGADMALVNPVIH